MEVFSEYNVVPMPAPNSGPEKRVHHSHSLGNWSISQKAHDIRGLVVDGPIHRPEVLISICRCKHHPGLGHLETSTAGCFPLYIPHLSRTHNEPGIMLDSVN